jgi:hypothetical protein
MTRSSQLLYHHADHPTFDTSVESANRQPPGITQLFIFTHPVVCTAILMIGFVVAALVSG